MAKEGIMAQSSPEFEGDERTIYTVFNEKVKRLDWVKIIANIHEQAKSHPDTVHIVHDFRSVQYRMMTTSLRHALQTARNIPDNVGAYIVLTNNHLMEFVGNMVCNLVPMVRHKIHFVSCEDSARKIIAQVEGER